MDLYVNTVANLILENYFMSSQCIFIFSDQRKFEYTGHLEAVNILVENGVFDEQIFYKFYGCQGFILDVKTPFTTFVNIEYCVRRAIARYNYRRFLILPLENSTEAAKDIFNSPEMEYVTDVLVMATDGEIISNDDLWFPTESLNFKFYTHKFVGINTTNEVVWLDDWWVNKSDFAFGNNLYPDKVSDGQGRAFTISTLLYVPFTVPKAKDGVELRLLVEFCTFFNLTSVVIEQEDSGNWGDIYANWTGIGMLGLVAMDEADVACAAIFRWEFMHPFLDFSSPFIRSGVSTVAPAPVLAQGWLGPLLPFDSVMWSAVLGSFFMCAMILVIIDFCSAIIYSYEEENKSVIVEHSLFTTISILLLQGIDDSAGVNVRIKKLMYSCMFIFTLLISSSYSSGLASSMTIPRYTGAIKTVQDLVDSGIAWGATSILWMDAIKAAPERNYVLLRQRFVLITEKTVIPEGKFAYIIEKLPQGYFSFGADINKINIVKLRRMLEDIYWEHCHFVTRKSSAWIPTLNKYLLIVVQSGIQQFWEYSASMKYSNPSVQRFVKFATHQGDLEEPVVLKLGHVQGAFGALVLGLILACVIFGIEKCLKRKL